MYNEVSIINNTLNGTWKTRLIIYAVCLLEKRKFEIDSENNCFLWSKHHCYLFGQLRSSYKSLSQLK